jgi:hypothetical protein
MSYLKFSLPNAQNLFQPADKAECERKELIEGFYRLFNKLLTSKDMLPQNLYQDKSGTVLKFNYQELSNLDFQEFLNDLTEKNFAFEYTINDADKVYNDENKVYLFYLCLADKNQNLVIQNLKDKCFQIYQWK